jgi:uncharacterized membrane protein YgdD (TMEM256/DUF423 family)
MKQKNILLLGIVTAATAVILGAFGAHGLKKMVTTEQLDIFKTGVQYQFYHAMGIILVGVIAQHIDHVFIKRAASMFFFGIIAFSGSLYLMTLFFAQNTEGPKWIGPITPLGGVLFIAGWALLGLGIYKSKNIV